MSWCFHLCLFRMIWHTSETFDRANRSVDNRLSAGHLLNYFPGFTSPPPVKKISVWGSKVQHQDKRKNNQTKPNDYIWKPLGLKRALFRQGYLGRRVSIDRADVSRCCGGVKLKVCSPPGAASPGKPVQVPHPAGSKAAGQAVLVDHPGG